MKLFSCSGFDHHYSSRRAKRLHKVRQAKARTIAITVLTFITEPMTMFVSKNKTISWAFGHRVAARCASECLLLSPA